MQSGWWPRQWRDRSVLLSARSTRLHRPGFFRQPRNAWVQEDFAEVYVIAHEVDITCRICSVLRIVCRRRGRVSQSEYNQLSVRLELQEIFWLAFGRVMPTVKHAVEAGDIEEAMRAASGWRR
jgi:predicted metalloprotease